MKTTLLITLVTLFLLYLLLLPDEASARRGKGSRRRKMGKQNAKVVFNTNPKRAEYYNNVDVCEKKEEDKIYIVTLTFKIF